MTKSEFVNDTMEGSAAPIPVPEVLWKLEALFSPALLPLFKETLQKAAPGPWMLNRVVPGKTLAISLTGAKCELRCAHCNGHYLKTMTPWASLKEADLRTKSSVLISGGSRPDGSVPVEEYLPDILKLPPHLVLNIHVGLQGAEKILALKGRKAVISFDLVGDDETVQEVFGVSRSARDYQEAFLELSRHFKVIPHLTIGLRKGLISGEEKVIAFLKKHNFHDLTFLVFRPTLKTPLGDAPPPEIAQVVRVIRSAAEKLTGDIRLGCMRPAGEYRRILDPLAWVAGARSIVHPDRRLVQALEASGIPIHLIEECCSIGGNGEHH